MNSFRYTHNDGRTGEGWSAWAAIVAAIGPAEGQTLPKLEDPRYEPEAGEDFHARAAVETDGGNKIGELFKLV